MATGGTGGTSGSIVHDAGVQRTPKLKRDAKRRHQNADVPLIPPLYTHIFIAGPLRTGRGGGGTPTYVTDPPRRAHHLEACVMGERCEAGGCPCSPHTGGLTQRQGVGVHAPPKKYCIGGGYQASPRHSLSPAVIFSHNNTNKTFQKKDENGRIGRPPPQNGHDPHAWTGT